VRRADAGRPGIRPLTVCVTQLSETFVVFTGTA